MGEDNWSKGEIQKLKIQKLVKSSQGFFYLIGDYMKKKYVLKIVYDTRTQEIDHLSESFTDEDRLCMLVDDEEIDISEELRELLDEMDSYIIGLC